MKTALSLTCIVALITGCGGATEIAREPLVVGAANGPIGAWVEVPWFGADPSVPFNGASLRTSGDSAYLLVADRLYRSDDHGSHWSFRGRQDIVSEFAVRGTTLFGWSGDSEAPLVTSTDDGLTWRGRPVATYSDDQIVSTGAFASPELFRSLGPFAVMVQPKGDRAPYVSADPSVGWTRVPLTTRDAPTIADVGFFGGDAFACTASGLYRYSSVEKTWREAQLPNVPPNAGSHCTFTTFTTLLCMEIAASYGGGRLYCSTGNDAWTVADRGLFNETPDKPEWKDFLGLGYVEGSAQVGATYAIADRGDNNYAKTDEGVYTTTNPLDGWTRVELLRGLRIVDVQATSQAILVLAQTKSHDNDAPLRLFRLRVR